MSFVIYLLCDASHSARCSHYIGSTRADQFTRRMTDHVSGTASKTTAKMLAQGAQLVVGAVWESSSRELEVRLKARGHYEKLCRRCRGELPLDLPAMPPKRNQGPAATGPWSALGF